MTILAVEGLVKRFGGFVATDGLDLALSEGEIHAVIGPNGAGKTTLVNQLSGNIMPDAGRILFLGQDVTRAPPDRRARAGIGRSYQITSVFPDLTALENVMLAVQGTGARRLSFWRPALQQTELVEPALAALKDVGLEATTGERARELAHGARRQLELAMTIAMRPKLLLLDEPMAGMSHHESAVMAKLLTRLKQRYTILLVEHDMDIVFSLADRITVLVYGKALVCGTSDVVRNHAEVKAAYLGAQEDDL